MTLVLATVLASCAHAGAGSPRPATPPSSPSAPAPSGTLTASTGPAPVTVSDSGGSTFAVTAAPVVVTIAVTTNSFLWSSAPGQTFLADDLTVKNVGTAPEPLSDFDDLTSGLADDVSFVMSTANAASLGYSSDCGVDPVYGTSLCPITYGQGLTVDSDSADHDSRTPLVLAPGSSARLILSYGPVLTDVVPSAVSVYFDGGEPVPADLTP
ncbi:MAG: hypothetical protein ABSG81_02835 [Acidimicrobiales bacterium]